MSNPPPATTEDRPRLSIDRLVVGAAIIDLAVGLALVAVAAVFWFASAGFDEADSTGIGAATFPRGIAVLLGVAAAMLAARAIMSLCGRLPSITNIISRPGHVLAGMGLVILFPVLMNNLGYYIGSALWMPALFVVAGYRKPLGIVIMTAGFLVFAKVGFEMILGVRLP
jgi:hypothetical protein